ncbi:hypothetical protein A7A08_01681 [Methyloligella halotolerans]|uniref:Uncharacterized protein n=1 Tax=Methyloligella halotolerans TaxID=1177755 RepID=A0A1E2RZI6_9HYPH|nr:hypothetical protein [Methyloligella halotolerans]ODA67646.1 hypothetical protein A7A08_01681 [Methyloligella halotolerans]
MVQLRAPDHRPPGPPPPSTNNERGAVIDLASRRAAACRPSLAPAAGGLRSFYLGWAVAAGLSLAGHALLLILLFGGD